MIVAKMGKWMCTMCGYVEDDSTGDCPMCANNDLEQIED